MPFHLSFDAAVQGPAKPVRLERYLLSALDRADQHAAPDVALERDRHRDDRHDHDQDQDQHRQCTTTAARRSHSAPRSAARGCELTKAEHSGLRPARAGHGWFTEGFDTADLDAAKALLDELR